MKLRDIIRMSIGISLTTLIACGSQNEDNTDLKINQTPDTIATTSESDIGSKTKQSITLENADSAMGKLFFIQCQACHTLEKGADNLIGPNLWGLLERAAGKHEGFQYSAGLAAADFNWNLENLNQFLIKPNDFIPDTTMIFNGITDEKIRHNILAYLVQATTEK